MTLMGTATRKPANATLEPAAAYLQVSQRTVQNYQDRGLLKTVYLGKRRFFRWSDIEKLAKYGTPLPQKEVEQIAQ